jgi:hypothetical protein
MKYGIYRRCPPLYSTTLFKIIGELNYHWVVKILITNDYRLKNGEETIIAKSVCELKNILDFDDYAELL